MENKEYSMLIVALYCGKSHVVEYISNLRKKNPLVDITLLSEKPNVIKNILLDNHVSFIRYNVSSVSDIRIPWLKELIIKYKQRRFFSKFSKNRRYDIVNVHFPNKYMSFVYEYLRDMSDNIVITPWGSDVLRRTKDDLKQLSILYNKADYIATSPDMPLGKKILQEFKVNPQKMVGNFWGGNAIDYAIQKGESISQDEAKLRFGLVDRYVITCGYNRQVAQQHKAIIKAIDQVREQLPDNLTLLFPMTYGKKGSYCEELKEECKIRNLQSMFVTDFLSVEDLYKLKKATDIFVHVQTTDASSASVKEYILCNKKIVHGSWIKYEAMEAFSPLFYFPVDKLENLGEVIVKAYKSENIEIPQGVINYAKNSSWDNKATLMNKFFMSIVNNK